MLSFFFFRLVFFFGGAMDSGSETQASNTISILPDVAM